MDVSDAMLTLRVFFLGDGAIPEPFDGCGVDPTSDPLDCLESCFVSR